MTEPRHNLEAVAQALFGSRWQVELAEACSVSTRTVRRWHRKPADVDRWVFHRLGNLAKERRAACDSVIASLAKAGFEFGSAPSLVAAPAPVAAPETPKPKLGNQEIVAKAAASMAAYHASKVVETGTDPAVMAAIEDGSTVAVAKDVTQPPVRPRPRGRPGFVPPALRPVAVRDPGISLSEMIGNDARDAQEAMRRLTYDDLRAGDRMTIHYRQMLRTAHVVGRDADGNALVSDMMSDGKWRSPRPLKREEFAEVTLRNMPTPDLPETPSPEAIEAQSARAAWLATLGVDDVRIGDAIEITRDLHDGKGLRKYTAQVTYVKRGRLQITYRTKRGMKSHSIDPRRFVRIVSRPLSRGETISPTTASETMGSEPSQIVMDLDLAPPQKHIVDAATKALRTEAWREFVKTVDADHLLAGDTITVKVPGQPEIRARVTRVDNGTTYIQTVAGDFWSSERPLKGEEFLTLYDRIGLSEEIRAAFPARAIEEPA